MSQRLTTVAHAEPGAPMAGLPRCPYTNTQLSSTLARFADRITASSTRNFPSAWRLCRSTPKNRKGKTPAMEMITYEPASGTSGGAWCSVTSTACTGASSTLLTTPSNAASRKPRWMPRATAS